MRLRGELMNTEYEKSKMNYELWYNLGEFMKESWNGTNMDKVMLLKYKWEKWW